ncbi:DUF2971 domain-containing protein [Rhizobium leguminosarum]|uniref:DUF2971 domain-containing protein n=2 Tax=Rhizobium leguminosarum TaxID=384 RepID=UPI0013F14F48|nr:DUF2971 domain-containing protein [Rhizobium leguminosarum]
MPYYHYCSASAFFHIIKNKSVWLSSLTASNDSMEGKWLSNIIGIAAHRWGISEFERPPLISLVRDIEHNLDCLGFCMSEAADSLSQWRGYADDGAGFGIGFSDTFIEEFTDPDDPLVFAQKIVYKVEDQLKLLEPISAQIVQAIRDGAFSSAGRGGLLGPVKTDEERETEQKRYKEAHGRLFKAITSDIQLFFKIKNAAFSEEQEWRLSRMAIKPLNDLEFRVTGPKVIPYLEQSFAEINDPITDVLIGPKNPNPKDVVIGFLARHGFDHVFVDTSGASYR